MDLEYFDNIDDYIIALENSNGLPIVTCERDKDDFFYGRYIRSKFLDFEFFYFEDIGYRICQSLSKRLTNIQYHKIDKFSNCNKIKVVIGLANDENQLVLDSFIKKFFNISYIFLVSGNIQNLTYLIAKFLTVASNQDIDAKSFFLNLIEPSHQIKENEVLKVVSRKNYPYEFLTESEENYAIGAIVSHAEKDVLYVGNKELGPTSDKNLSSIANNLGLKSLFLDSCFGMYFSNKKNTIYEDLAVSSLDSFICYRGIKDNYFYECMWYVLCRLRGLNSADSTLNINKNLQFRTSDFPNYVNIGFDNFVYNRFPFVEYEVDSSKKMFLCNGNGEACLGKCSVSNLSYYEDFSLVSPNKIFWLIDYVDSEILFFTEKNKLPLELKFINLEIELEKVVKNFDFLIALRKSWSKLLMNKILAYSQQLENVAEMLTKARAVSDIAYKCYRKIQDLNKQEDEIKSLLLTEIGRGSLSCSPFSESYIHKFKLEQIIYSNNYCPNCGQQLMTKRLVNIIEPKNERFIDYCLACGQVKDLGTNNQYIEFLDFNFFGDSLEINLKSCINEKILLVIPEVGIKLYSINQGDNKIYVKNSERKKIKMIKCFYICEEKLNVIYKNKTRK